MKASLEERFQFCPELIRLIATRRAVGKSGRTFGNAGVSTANNLAVIRHLMMEHRPERTLEIRIVFWGSALVFATSHRDLGRSPEGQHTAIDPFRHTSAMGGLTTPEKASLREYVDFRETFSSIELPRLLQQQSRFGLIYVDGSHLFEVVFVDCYFAIRLAETGGLIALDDSCDPHVAKVIRFLRKNLAAALAEVDLYRFRSPGVQRLLHRLAYRIRRTQLTVFQRVGPADRNWNAPLHGF